MNLGPLKMQLLSTLAWPLAFQVNQQTFSLHLSFFFKVYLFERDRRQCAQVGDTEYETGSRIQAVSTEPNTGLELTSCEIMT